MINRLKLAIELFIEIKELIDMDKLESIKILNSYTL